MSDSTMICPRCWGVIRPCDLCSGTGKRDNVLLSKNFMLSELVHSDTAIARKISNDPNSFQVARLRESCEKLWQPLRDEVGVLKVTSGFRSPALNAVIGGSSKSSAHMGAYAIDTEPQHVTREELMSWFARTKLPFDQAIHETTGSRKWVHIGFKNGGGVQRRQLLKMQDGQWSVWTP